ncbi:hypothetical protein Fmac_007547 [Flemingia macrophylla]|uniref:Uncharacterized protein n=1 Tax=Flemingia macrophylla TaxID=520843 RepID=A0ABD1MUW5_9FABA
MRSCDNRTPLLGCTFGLIKVTVDGMYTILPINNFDHFYKILESKMVEKDFRRF